MSLIATRLQSWRVKNPNLDKNNNRTSRSGALEFFVQETNSPTSILSPNLKERAFASMGNDVTVPVIKYDGDVKVANTRSCVIADAENTSQLYQVSFATYAVGFTMVPTAYMNNEIDYEHDFSRKMQKHVNALLKELDKTAIATLEAQKSQVFGNPLYYQTTGNSIQCPWDLRTNILGDLDALMESNDYNGTIHLIGDSGLTTLINQLNQKGEYNEENKRLEFANKVLHTTNNIVNETGVFSSLYAVEEGNVGVLTRVDREALVSGKGAGHEWGVTTIQGLDLPVGYHYYVSAGDQSAIAGDATKDVTCARKEHFSFSLDVAFVIAYNSNPDKVANPILKAEIHATDSLNPNAKPVVIANTADNPVFTKSSGTGE